MRLLWANLQVNVKKDYLVNRSQYLTSVEWVDPPSLLFHVNCHASGDLPFQVLNFAFLTEIIFDALATTFCVFAYFRRTACLWQYYLFYIKAHYWTFIIGLILFAYCRHVIYSRYSNVSHHMKAFIIFSLILYRPILHRACIPCGLFVSRMV